MIGVKTHSARQTTPGVEPPPRSNTSHSGDGQLPASAPLNLYLTRLLEPNPKPPEPPVQPPIQEQTHAPAKSAAAESTWQRAKNNAARTLRAATPRTTRKSDSPSPANIPAEQVRPISRRKPNTRTSAESAGDRSQKIMMALIPVLAFTMLFLLKNPLKMSRGAPMQSAQPVVAPAVTSSDVEIAWEIPPLYPLGGRDPMRLPTPPVVSTTVEESAASVQTRVELIVTGILYSEDRPAAIVDTQLVHEGQQIAGATVRKIEMDGVEFEMDGRTWKQAVDK